MDDEQFSLEANRSIILWEDVPDIDGHYRVAEVLVCLKNEQPAWSRRLTSSRGACDASWLDGDERNSPIGIWVMLETVYGFASQETRIAALRQFIKINGQDWAVWMLEQIDPSFRKSQQIASP